MPSGDGLIDMNTFKKCDTIRTGLYSFQAFFVLILHIFSFFTEVLLSYVWLDLLKRKEEILNSLTMDGFYYNTFSLTVPLEMYSPKCMETLCK